MSENAFNPDNTHLWIRCKAHSDGSGPKFCSFVENCAECEENCLHDYVAPLDNE